jgi:hypothetical protein
MKAGIIIEITFLQRHSQVQNNNLLIVQLSVQNRLCPDSKAFHSQERWHRNHPKPTNNRSHHSQANAMLGRKRSANLPSKRIPPVLRDSMCRMSLTRYSKHASEYYDPCQDFADRSLKCMKRNAFDREMCGDYFQYVVPFFPATLLVLGFCGLTRANLFSERAYRDCKKEWVC